MLLYSAKFNTRIRAQNALALLYSAKFNTRIRAQNALVLLYSAKFNTRIRAQNALVLLYSAKFNTRIRATHQYYQCASLQGLINRYLPIVLPKINGIFNSPRTTYKSHLFLVVLYIYLYINSNHRINARQTTIYIVYI